METVPPEIQRIILRRVPRAYLPLYCVVSKTWLAAITAYLTHYGKKNDAWKRLRYSDVVTDPFLLRYVLVRTPNAEVRALYKEKLAASIGTFVAGAARVIYIYGGMPNPACPECLAPLPVKYPGAGLELRYGALGVNTCAKCKKSFFMEPMDNKSDRMARSHVLAMLRRAGIDPADITKPSKAKPKRRMFGHIYEALPDHD